MDLEVCPLCEGRGEVKRTTRKMEGAIYKIIEVARWAENQGFRNIKEALLSSVAAIRKAKAHD